MSKIQKQVKLPLSVAFGVALQGIRVRFERSLVTIMGVLLGIAFLMAIFTGQVIKSGVGEEQALRQKTKRMYNFLVAEMGIPRERTVAVLVTGPLTRAESRLLGRIADEKPAALRWQKVDGVKDVTGLPRSAVATPIAELGADANAIIVMGDVAPPPAVINQLLAEARYKLICVTREEVQLTVAKGARLVPLERVLPPEEIEAQALAASRDKARNLWIIIISLLVTVIGISNSMLMSVTERFREIGTMKCLGALSMFIRQLFLIESSFVGLVGALAGALAGMLFSMVAYMVTYGAPLVFQSLQFGRLGLYFVISVVLGVALSVIAALYPARFASRMLPAHALRSNI